MFSRHHLRILPFLVCGAIFSDYRGLVFCGQLDKALQVFKQKKFNYSLCEQPSPQSALGASCASDV
jgi:hypothetical protein